jgi:hypothetical protein
VKLPQTISHLVNRLVFNLTSHSQFDSLRHSLLQIPLENEV